MTKEELVTHIFNEASANRTDIEMVLEAIKSADLVIGKKSDVKWPENEWNAVEARAGYNHAQIGLRMDIANFAMMLWDRS